MVVPGRLPPESRALAAVGSVDTAPAAGWDGFSYWASCFARWDQFHVNGAGEVAEQRRIMGLLRDLVTGAHPRWPDGLEEAMGYQSAVGWRAYLPVVKWARENPSDAASTLSLLWTSAPAPERIDAFLERLPAEVLSGPGTRLALAVSLLSDDDLPPYQPRLHDFGHRLTATPPPDKSIVGGARYVAYLDLLDQIRAEVGRRGVTLLNRSQAYGVLVWVAKGDTWFSKGLGPNWSEGEKAALGEWLRVYRDRRPALRGV